MNRRTLAVLASISGLMLICAQQAAAAITYISATRSVDISASTQSVHEDAIGFNDFDASYTRFISSGGPPTIRVSAAQQSYLRSDRIDVFASAYTGPGSPQLTSASSVLRVTFSVDVETPFTLYTGPIFHESFEGGAGTSLNSGSAVMQPYLAITEVQTAPISGLLQPGTYTFSVGAIAGRLQNITGQSTAIASLVLPEPATVCLITLGIAVKSRRRRV